VTLISNPVHFGDLGFDFKSHLGGFCDWSFVQKHYAHSQFPIKSTTADSLLVVEREKAVNPMKNMAVTMNSQAHQLLHLSRFLLSAIFCCVRPKSDQ